MSKFPFSPRRLDRWFCRPLLALLLVLLCCRAVAHLSLVQGCSMRPTIRDGDRLVVESLSPRLGAIARFDVVILRNPRNPAEDFVKRVVGLPGERITFRRGRLLVDGRVVPEFFPKVVEFHDCREWVVPPEHYFVAGDNRPLSLDSRSFGVVPRTLLRGKVQYRLWPPARLGPLARD